MKLKKVNGKYMFDGITEAVKFKKVVRQGKVIKKKTTDREGYKIDPQTGKEIRMSPDEIRRRKKAAKKAKLKRKGKKAQITRARKKSEKVRKSRNI